MRKLLVLLLLLGVLFISSGQTYEQQSLVPTLKEWLPNQPFMSLLSKLEIPYWGRIISVEERGYYYFIEFLLRKSAHFIIFGCVALAVYAVLPRFKFRFIGAALITLCFAILDEFHQFLTGGRTASHQDVWLDFAGAVFALSVLWLIRWMQSKKIRQAHRP